MAPRKPATEKRTIRHALFWYGDPADPAVERTALRGQTVDLLAADIKRGEAEGAFTDEVGEVPGPPVGTLMRGWPDDETEQDAWITEATADEVLTWAADHPEHREAIVAAELRRGDMARADLADQVVELPLPEQGDPNAPGLAPAS